MFLLGLVLLIVGLVIAFTLSQPIGALIALLGLILLVVGLTAVHGHRVDLLIGGPLFVRLLASRGNALARVPLAIRPVAR